MRTVVSGEGIPASDIDLVATGDLQGLRLQPLKVGVLDGRLHAEGKVRWDQGVDWELQLQAEQINPGLYLSDWPGELGGRMELGGSLAAAGGELAVRARIRELAGRLRDYPVSASGSLDYRAGQLQAQGVELASGPNRIQLDGRAGESLDLGFDIKAPELASFYPGLSGALEGSGQLKGTRQAPVVVARLSGNAFAYQDMRAQDLKLDIDWREQGGKGWLQASGVDAGGLQIVELSADLDGSPDSHRLNLAADSPAGALGLTAQGGLQAQSWQGELQRLDLAEPTLGEWLLQAPVKLRLGAERASASQLCLTQAATTACAQGVWDAAKGLDIAGSLAGLDLARLAPHLPGDAVVEGQLRGDFRVSGAPARPDVVFELIPGDGLIRVEDDGEPLELAFRNARVSGRFADDRGSADLRFELGPNGRAQGRVLLGPDTAGQRALGGEIDADFPDLGLVAGFVPVLQQVEGRLHIEGKLGGILAAPRLTGALEIADARAQVPALGIELTDVGLKLSGDGDGPLRVTGQLSSGEGRLDVAGTVDPAARGGPAVDLTVQGDNFRAVQLPEALVEIAPELRLQGAGPYHLSGKVLIPLAAIELQEVPSGTVDVSSDEIIVGEQVAEQRPTGGRNLTARVRIELGEAVTFEGFGLETGLTGALDASVDAQGTSVDGKIELRDGEYKAYGQDLKVERGRLLFAGPPGNPDVDLRAVRVSNNGEVRAYLAMNGPLSKPRPRIYSEPALPETEALAYLVTGNGLSDAGQGDGANIAAAALSLGLSKADPVMQKLTAGLGLDEISVDAGGEEGLEDSAVTLGKYLNPDLYVGYSQGLFNPEGAVLMRLKLREKLTLESRSGNEQSVDLFYRIEHD
jgi:translocation and assembly module TamB